jgi:hypothetical protein
LLASTSAAIPLDRALPHLLTPLTSHSRIVRSSALDILAGPCVTRSATQTAYLSRIVAAEEVPLTIQSSRERVVNIGKVIDASGSVGGDNMHKIVARWLIGKFPPDLFLCRPRLNLILVHSTAKDQSPTPVELNDSDSWDLGLDRRVWRGNLGCCIFGVGEGLSRS